MSKRIRIELSEDERRELREFASTGVRSARLISRAKIILELDQSEGRAIHSQNTIAEKVGVSRQTVVNARADFLVSESVERFLQRKKRETPPVEAKITGDVEAHIIALACSEPPEGCAKWTLRLLADRSVKLGYIDSISHMTVSRLLKKRNLSLT